MLPTLGKDNALCTYRRHRRVCPTGLFGVSGGEMCLTYWSVWCIGKRDVFDLLVCLVYREERCVCPSGLFGVSGRDMCLSDWSVWCIGEREMCLSN